MGCLGTSLVLLKRWNKQKVSTESLLFKVWWVSQQTEKDWEMVENTEFQPPWARFTCYSHIH